MAKKTRIVVVGPSGSGKSTLIDYMRGPEFINHVIIPKRVITLPVREDSNAVENRNVSHEAFQREVDARRIKPWWQRQLGEDQETQHFYGFERVRKKDARIRLFLGNNALLDSDSEQVQKLIGSSLMVIVTAQPDVRANRLDERLPNMDDAERLQRITDGLEHLRNFQPLGLEVIDTTNRTQEDTQKQFADIIFTHAGVTVPMPARTSQGVPLATQ